MKLCSRCRKEPRRAPGQRLCKACHSANMRAWRKTHQYVRKTA